MIDITKYVKFKNPEDPEEGKLVFKITNYNEGTQRAYISPVNSGMAIPPEELVSVDDLENTEYGVSKSDPLNNEELALVAEITAKIREACVKSKYTHICQRIQNENGLAYVVNRCIKSMSMNKIHLSAALANLENEMEGMD